MDRCALFVDAGYALGDGALAVHGTRNRDSVSWDYAGLLKLLSSLSRDRTGLPLLRCYWYDVAGAGSRAAEHDALADLPGVKLRLTKVRPGRKEGVEAEIRRDLTALARNRSVSDVIVVSAEEDLAPVISEVQEFGVRVLLLHIGTDGSWAEARALRQECDEVVEISPSHLRPYVDLISGAEPQLAAVGYRELPPAAAQASGPHPGPEANGARLYDSPVPGGYERAVQLAAAGEPSLGQPPLGPTQPGQPPAGQQQPAFGGADNGHSANGHGAARPAPDFSQRGMAADERGQGGPALAAGGDQPVMGAGQPPVSAGQGAHGALPGTGIQAGGHANGGPASAGPIGGGQGNGMSGHGLPGSGLTTHDQLGSGLPGEPSAQAMQQGGMSHSGSAGGQLGAGPGGPQHQLPGQPFPPAGPGQPFPGQPQPGQQPQALPPPHQAAQEMPLSSSALPPQSVQPLPQPGPPGHGAGQHGSRGLDGQQNGLVPFDAQRPPLPQRQLPAGNGLPYGQDRGGAPYAGQLPPAQFDGPAGQQPYGAGSYGALQPSAPPPAQLPVADAVQSAHAEGYGFGEAVARDAPALWLEAVLARKPRMPSDLEARLLQGSALPIDSLLHDEVRHALRRGFWDALERSRH